MHNIGQLEAQWKRYKRKKRRPLYLSIVIVVAFTALVIWMIKNNQTISLHVFKKDVSVALQTPSSVFENHANSHLLVDGFITALDEEESDERSDEVDLDEDLLANMPPNKRYEISQKKPIRHQDKIHLEVTDSSNVSAYQDIEKRFLQNPDIDDALFLSKGYYRQGQYEKAAYWALETNKLDESLEESILIFVKSKVKLKHSNEATSILRNYIEKSNSPKAVELLYRIETDGL
ncbi:MAG: hypothetical protein RL113_122 [Pseudomonadota bacterium]|jgi:hypothetical protein